jgi:retron-type reverse transcriptase
VRRTGHLFEKITAFSTLWRAAHRAWRGKKDNRRIAKFYFYLEPELLRLQQELQAGRYVPRPYRVFTIKEPKQRRIAAADFRDRVVHHAICEVLEPLFERSLIHDTYACRVGKGNHAALKRAQQFVQKYPYYLQCDISQYFASVDHQVLRRLLARRIKDWRLLALLDLIIDHPLPEHEPGKGLPIGNLTSQHFANLYLGELDHHVKDRLGVPAYLRYMDDFVLFEFTKPRLHQYLAEIRRFLKGSLQLQLKAQATRVAPVTEGLAFLGFRLFPGAIRLQARGLTRFRCRVRARERAYLAGEIDDRLLSASVNSMIAHMAHADTLSVRRQLFSDSMGLG